MSDRQGFLVRNGLIATGVLAALMLLTLFYSTVSGAVDRATQRRAESADNARLSLISGSLPNARRFVALTGTTR